jgi:hypothetical protein
MAEGKKDQEKLTGDETSGSAPTPPTETPDVAGGDLPGAAQATQAELDAAEEKARTTYVLLLWRDVYVLVGDPEESAEAVQLDGGAWVEVDKIRAASRAAAWEEAKRRHPQVKPTVPGEETRCQLVPKRFFQTVTARAKPPLEPELEVEGL